MKIEDLNLDVRTYNAVRRAGFATVEELRQRMADDPDELRRDIGSGTFETVEEALAGVQESAVILENPEAHARAYYLRDDTKARLSVIEENYYAVCKNMKEMRDGKLYKELGYQNFEDCCNTEFGLKRRQTYKYISIAENLSPDFVHSNAQIGTTKLSLLAMLDEPTREAVTETVDVENTTVKELKAQITALTAERDENEHAASLLSEELDSAKESLASKDKQFKEAMEAKDKQLKAAQDAKEAAVSDCKNYFNGVIREKDNRIKELEDAPITHDITDADLAEENKRLKRELEDEQLRYTVLEGSVNARTRNAAEEVRQEYERKIAEMQSTQPDEQEASADTKAVFKAYLANAADALTRLMAYLEGIKGDANMPLYVSKVDGIVEMTQTRRNAL